MKAVAFFYIALAKVLQITIELEGANLSTPEFERIETK